MASTADKHRDWNWEDGTLEGLYVETREVSIRNGPSAGTAKLIFDFHVGLGDELVSVFETAVLRSKFANELRARRKQDFEPGESIRIEPLEWRETANGRYRDFDVTFEHAAPKRTAADLLSSEASDDVDEADSGPSRPADDGDIPF